MKSQKLTVLFVYATIVSHDGRAITIDGHRRVLLSGSIHYPRSTPEMWPDLIKKGKEGGLDAIETYVFWNAHEPTRRQYDFSGKLDLIRFLKTIQDEGLYGVLRIGPYACAEWNYGGFPVWLHNMPGMVFRTTNKAFMDEMQNFTTMIVDMVKKENLFASQGGPIILAQIENEYGNVMGPYGESGKSYIKWCANMAQSLNVGVPWVMCQQNDAPQPMLNTCNGFYCDNFVPNNPNTPKMWTENWTGWFKQWGGKNPHRTTEDVAFSVARFFQRGGTFNNYYMYHGGTNFDRTAGGPYITTSYDYDAPLDEYGNLNQPKYGHLKQLHDVLHSMEKTLTYGNISTIDFGNSASATFKAPLGNDPVVVDLLGLGKGTAWVNGNNIGRYWPAFISSENGCAAKCNYRGPYHAEKCLTNCGEPTQRWYHVPRSFLNAEGDNTLVLFEEMGGNPSLVNFQTTRVGSVCANVYEKNTIELSCDRKPISAIKFASFGNPDGNCGSFKKGTCESSNNTVDILAQECVGKEKCFIDVSTEKFGAPDCTGSARRLAVEAIC
ncbi:hypothetical protein F2Q70_00044123 [Brassica cretica]|uniref:beta-galactosidase n=1 Tax=Brassica cretica TaxID=69181 RepID=A0A8S9KH54_BRACR|nr:hypothetical protein F2Q70_00044123 [Brassica cretica]